MTTPPAPATPYGVYRAGYVPQTDVPHLVHHPDGTVQAISPARGRLMCPAASSGWRRETARWRQ